MNTPNMPYRFSRRTLLASGAAALTASAIRVARSNDSPADDSLRNALGKAVDYLWSQQSDDGAWHSPKYGVLRAGQALTPFVLHALLQAPRIILTRRGESVERAIDFIRSLVNEQGSL